MSNTREIKIRNLAELEQLALELGKQVSPGMGIGLVGELGAGKTTFTRSLVKALGSAEPVSSPTFVVEHLYSVLGNKDLKIIEHWDLYRLNQLPEELSEPVSPDTIRMVEWVDKFEELEKSLDLRIEILIPEDYNSDHLALVGAESPRNVVLQWNKEVSGALIKR